MARRILRLLLFLSFLVLPFLVFPLLTHGAALPPAERWLTHIETDIAPFWLTADALGEPVGNFPTFRCNDGSAWSSENDCGELRAPWIGPLDRHYIRMQSRQVYTYGAIYHLTGDEAAFAAMQAGVAWLLEYAFKDVEGQGAPTYLVNGEAAQEPIWTTAQDQAYALLGLAMYYYLTRDEVVLPTLLAQQRYIFGRYYDAQWGMLRWDLSPVTSPSSKRQELVAQLDQINAYLLLLAPILPEPHRRQWQDSLRQLVEILLEHYYCVDEQRFYGTIDTESGKSHHARHGDFGHTAKAFWMIYLVGQQLGDADYQALAEEGLLSVFERAYQTKWDFTFWAGHEDGDGSAWWEFAELNQAAATLLAKYPPLADKLAGTYGYWLAQMVDKTHGGIWPVTFARNAPKVHLWKNGYHAAEHALVAYITTARHQQRPYRLYFAPKKTAEIAPGQLGAYFFGAEPAQVERLSELRDGFVRLKASYR